MQIALGVILSLVTGGSIARAALPACTPEFILGTSCAQLQQEPLNLRSSKTFAFSPKVDGTVVLNPVFAMTNQDSPELARLAEFSATAEQRADSIVALATEEARTLIIGGTQPKALTAEQKAMLKRLDTLRFRVVENDSDFCSSNVPLGFPNLSYNGDTHTIQICPAAINAPSVKVFQDVAHELGHALHSCMLEAPLFAVSDSGRDRSAVRSCFGDLDDDDGELSAIRSFIGDGAFKLASESRAIKQYEICGLLNRVRTDGNYKREPSVFRGLHLCLDKAHFAVHKRQMTEAIEETRGEMPQAKPHVLKKVAATEVGSLRCFRMSEENFADALSAKILGRYIAKARPSSEQVRAGLIEWAGWACSEQIHGRSKGSINYPTARHRFNTIINDTAIAAAVGCSLTSEVAGLCSVDSNAPAAISK